MPYAVQQDLIDRFGSKDLIELTDHANVGVIDSTVLARAITDASTEIDGYLAGIYTLPLSTVPLVVTRLACDMARYYLMGDRVTDAVAARYKNAVTFLRAVADGKASLGLDATNKLADESGGVSFRSATQVFTSDELVDY